MRGPPRMLTLMLDSPLPVYVPLVTCSACGAHKILAAGQTDYGSNSDHDTKKATVDRSDTHYCIMCALVDTSMSVQHVMIHDMPQSSLVSSKQANA